MAAGEQALVLDGSGPDFFRLFCDLGGKQLAKSAFHKTAPRSSPSSRLRRLYTLTDLLAGVALLPVVAAAQGMEAALESGVEES